LAKLLPAGISINWKATSSSFPVDDSRDNRARHGLVRAHLANMVKGVTDGWTRELEINGVGYRAEVAGDTVTFALGYAHPIVFKLPKIVSAKVEKNRLTLTSADKICLARSRPRCASCGLPSPTRARVSSTWRKSSSARLARLPQPAPRQAGASLQNHFQEKSEEEDSWHATTRSKVARAGSARCASGFREHRNGLAWWSP